MVNLSLANRTTATATAEIHSFFHNVRNWLACYLLELGVNPQLPRINLAGVFTPLTAVTSRHTDFIAPKLPDFHPLHFNQRSFNSKGKGPAKEAAPKVDIPKDPPKGKPAAKKVRYCFLTVFLVSKSFSQGGKTVKSPAVIDEKLEAVGEAAMPPPEDCGKFPFSNFHNLCFNPDAFSFAKIWTTVCLNPILLRTT